MMSIKLYPIALLTALTLSNAALSDENCEKGVVSNASFYFTESIEIDADPGKAYQEKTAIVEKFAEKHKLKDFTITSKDLSVSRSSYGGDRYDMNMSYSIQYASDKSIVTELMKELKVYSASFSSYTQNGCGSCGC